jgi:hypothetical protein
MLRRIASPIIASPNFAQYSNGAITSGMRNHEVSCEQQRTLIEKYMPKNTELAK